MKALIQTGNIEKLIFDVLGVGEIFYSKAPHSTLQGLVCMKISTTEVLGFVDFDGEPVWDRQFNPNIEVSRLIPTGVDDGTILFSEVPR